MGLQSAVNLSPPDGTQLGRMTFFPVIIAERARVVAGTYSTDKAR